MGNLGDAKCQVKSTNQQAGSQFLDQEPIVQMTLCLVFHSAGLAEVSEEFGQAAMLN